MKLNLDSGYRKINIDRFYPLGVLQYNLVCYTGQIMKRSLNLALIIVTVASVMTAVYYYQEVRRLTADPQVAATNELAEIVTKVGRLVVLPEGEEPTLATVADPELLKDQPFFARAKKGDKVLIYNQAQRALLYDPVADKIVEIAPITSGN